MENNILYFEIIIFVCSFILVFILIPEEESILKKRLKNTNKNKQEIGLNKLFKKLYELMQPLSQSNLREKQINTIKTLLLQAGQEASKENIILWEGRRIVNLILASLIGFFLTLIMSFEITAIAFALFLVYFAYNAPILELKNIIKKRQKDIMKYIADAVDLLSICVQAGLGLDAAIEKVSIDFSLTSKTVSEEFGRLSKDILSGIPKQEAYKNLSLRNSNKELQIFVALLIQTDKLGTGITQSLEAYCDSLRTRKRQRIEEIIQTTSVKMTIPMVIFMLIPIFIIILYPALSTIIKSL